MNNPGIDPKHWQQLRKKWTELDTKGHKLKIEFKYIVATEDKSKILAIDVIQHIDGKPITETVHRDIDEVYAAMSIAGLSMERLTGLYKEMLKQLHRQTKQRDTALIVTMSPTSPTSGEVKAYLEKPDDPVQSGVLVNYRHYYMLNALRDRMIELLGEGWTHVRVVSHVGDLAFYFEYL